MENNFNTPAQVFEANMKAGEGKVQLPLLKCILLGIMAGAFIAFGGATSSAAIHNISNQGIAKALAGAIFPVGLMMIVFVGGELFTGDCLMIAGTIDKRFSVLQMIRTLVVVWFSNMAGAVIISILVYYSGLLDYTSGALGAFTIKVAYGKCTITPFKAICSGILCNILVCIAVLMATAAKDIAGKVWAIFFPICAFVVGGWEHCVANMGTFSIAYLLFGSINPVLLAKSMICVTLGNIVGGALLLAAPLKLMSAEK